MSYADKLDEEISGLEIDQLPAELREQARKEKHSHGGYRFDSAADKQHIKEQRAAIWAWFRGLGGNLIKHGVNLTKVPLPVELCEPRTFLQRLTDSWSYTDLLHAAAACSDPAERLKLVVAFAVGGMRQQVSCDKPFNPILGETLQGAYPCGCRVYAEQVSHHPPVSCWQLLDHAGQFEFSGSSCWSATFTGNSVRGVQYGESRIRFARDGATVAWTLPTIHIRGVLFGDRVVKYHDTVTFTDAANNLRCELQVDPGAPKRGLVKRIISKARHPRAKAHDLLLGDLVWADPRGGREAVLDSCSGTWLTELSWDKGVRSTALPAAVQAAAAAAAAAASSPAGLGGGKADDDAASLGCHSIGSFSSSTSGTSSSASGSGDASGEVAPGEPNGEAGGSRLTASALAAHTEPEPAAARSGPAGGGAPQALGSAVSGSDAAGHRSGRGIGVTKRLWDAKGSEVRSLQPLADDDPQLLPSDCRYRPDVQALGGGARTPAQHWKLALEERQRRDRALRDAGNPHQHHHHQHSLSGTMGGEGEAAAADSGGGQQQLGRAGAASKVPNGVQH